MKEIGKDRHNGLEGGSNEMKGWMDVSARLQCLSKYIFYSNSVYEVWNVSELNKGFEWSLNLAFISVEKQKYKDPRWGITYMHRMPITYMPS